MINKKEKKIRLALAQINPTVGAFASNRESILDCLERSRSMRADITIFPELAVCGYPPEDLLLKKHFIAEHNRVLASLRREIREETVIIGCLDADTKGNLYNAAALIQSGTVKATYRKMCLPNYGVFDEKRYFAAGRSNHVFVLDSIPFGISICEDIWASPSVCKEQVRAGAQLLINISASPFHAGKRNERRRMLQEKAAEYKSHIAYLNTVGGQDELVFDGGSFVFSPSGRVLTEARHFEEDILFADLIFPCRPARKKKRVSTVRYVVLKRPDHPKGPRLKKKRAVMAEPVSEIYKALVLGTRDYVCKNSFKKVVLGLSGGIDSALVATIACDALGKENVVGITMPSRFSSCATQNDARRLSKNLGIQLIRLPIEKLYTDYLALLKQEFHGLPPGTAEENIQARIRGNLLMAFSNKFNWLVLTTGNKSETAVGYCTLYGDMAGGFAVLKDVSKTLVYALAQYRNGSAPKKIIPHSIITRAPSAELRDNQKDQDSLPPYEVLDTILALYIEDDRGYDQIVEQIGDPRLVRSVITLVDRNEYKRRQAPPGIKITPKAFGRDRRLPMTNRYIPK
jgi:NAD+ synthase (glutamine-hydrolysing)